MKKLIKVTSLVLVSLLVTAMAAVLYIFRPQDIDADLLPNQFEYCGVPIWGSDKRYLEITRWLKNNREGWKLSYASYQPKLWYRYPSYKVGLLQRAVVVSYKTDYGYPQFYKAIEHDLSMTCDSAKESTLAISNALAPSTLASRR